jgi:hypothetical protein
MYKLGIALCCSCAPQHTIVPPADEEDADVRAIIRKLSMRTVPTTKTSARIVESGESEFAAVRPYFGALFPPSKLSGQDARGDCEPQESLEMEYVHGYRGHDAARNLTYLSENELLYTAAALAVVLDVRNGNQRFFCEHTYDIMCMALHSSGRTVASAQAGGTNQVLVWHTSRMSVSATLTLPPGASPVALAFSQGDGSRLACVCAGAEQLVCLYEWAAARRIAMETASAQRILVVACHPDTSTIITCGVKNMNFWSLSKGHLTQKAASGGSGRKSQTMLCIGFTAENLTLTGAQNGCIYVWHGNVLHRTVVAHKGPILDLTVTRDGIMTCGKEGLLRLWDTDMTASVRIDVGELTKGMLPEGEPPPALRAVACVLADPHPEDASAELRRLYAVGTSTGRVVQLTYASRPHETDSLPEASLHALMFMLYLLITQQRTADIVQVIVR